MSIQSLLKCAIVLLRWWRWLGPARVAGASAGARERKLPPLEIAREGYIFAGGKYSAGRQGNGRADLRGIPDSRAPEASLSDRLRSRRKPDGNEFHGNSGRPRRLGAIFPAPRLCRVRCGSGRARPQRVSRRALRPANARRTSISSSRSFTASENYNLPGRRRTCTRNGPERARPAIRSSISFTLRRSRRWSSYPLQQELSSDAIIALLDKIGPAIMLTHSQSGAIGWPVADARPEQVKGDHCR